MHSALPTEKYLELLSLLSDWLHVKYPGQSWTLLIIGGAALAFTNHKETTLDIDVLAPYPLPNPIRDGVKAIAKAKRISNDWLNAGAGAVLAQSAAPHQLPFYFSQYETLIPVGNNLSIALPVRQALISSKLLAASPSFAKHTEDLKQLKPSMAELSEAVRFVCSCDSSDIRKQDLMLICRALGEECNDIVE